MHPILQDKLLCYACGCVYGPFCEVMYILIYCKNYLIVPLAIQHENDRFWRNSVSGINVCTNFNELPSSEKCYRRYVDQTTKTRYSTCTEGLFKELHM